MEIQHAHGLAQIDFDQAGYCDLLERLIPLVSKDPSHPLFTTCQLILFDRLAIGESAADLQARVGAMPWPFEIRQALGRVWWNTSKQNPSNDLMLSWSVAYLAPNVNRTVLNVNRTVFQEDLPALIKRGGCGPLTRVAIREVLFARKEPEAAFLLHKLGVPLEQDVVDELRAIMCNPASSISQNTVLAMLELGTIATPIIGAMLQSPQASHVTQALEFGSTAFDMSQRAEFALQHQAVLSSLIEQPDMLENLERSTEQEYLKAFGLIVDLLSYSAEQVPRIATHSMVIYYKLKRPTRIVYQLFEAEPVLLKQLLRHEHPLVVKGVVQAVLMIAYQAQSESRKNCSRWLVDVLVGESKTHRLLVFEELADSQFWSTLPKELSVRTLERFILAGADQHQPKARQLLDEQRSRAQ
jgi:hypothetical protein